MKEKTNKNKINNDKFYLPTEDEINFFKKKSRVVNTDKSTANWVHQFENFREKAGFTGKSIDITDRKELESQICSFVTVMKTNSGEEYKARSILSAIHALNRHLNDLSSLSPMDFTSRKQFPILYDVLDGKMKHVAEQGKANVQGADGLSVEECKKILYSPVLNIDTPTGLLKKVFFLNALFLALRGGEHYSLQYSHFKFRADGQGFDVNIPRSKTNQRGINGSLNDEKLRIPYHPMIMETYNKYFSKRPGNADKEFYLREYVSEDDYIIYNRWFQKFHVGEKRLKNFLHEIVIECGIDIGNRKISNHSARKSLVGILKELGTSDNEVMAITRHKSNSGFTSYERTKEKMQNVSLNNLMNVLIDNDQMEGSDVLEPLPHFSMPDKQALTPIELKSTFTSAREIFKAEINQESRIPFSNKSNKLTINETETLQDIFKGNGSIFNNCTFVFNR